MYWHFLYSFFSIYLLILLENRTAFWQIDFITYFKILRISLYIQNGGTIENNFDITKRH